MRTRKQITDSANFGSFPREQLQVEILLDIRTLLILSIPPERSGDLDKLLQEEGEESGK